MNKGDTGEPGSLSGTPGNPEEVRRVAESRASERLGQWRELGESGNVDRLLHELGVHQVELEMQNEELHRTQETLTAARDRYQDLYEYAPVGYLTLAADGRITEANRLAEMLIGQPVSRLVGHRLSDFLALPDRMRFRHRFARLLAGEAVGAQELDLAPRPERPGVRAALTMSLLIEEDGTSRYRVALLDITERAAMRQDASRLAAIVASSDEAIIGRAVDGVVTSWNGAAERLFGLSAAEAIGRPLGRLVPPERRAEEQDMLRRVRHGERLLSFETERCRADGTRVFVSVSISPIRDDEGRVVGSSLIARDIGERRRAERALHKRLRQLDLLSQVGQMLIMGDQGSADVRRELFDRVRLAVGGEICASYEIGDPPDTLRLSFERGLSETQREAMARLPMDGSLCGTATRRRSPLIVENLQDCDMPEADVLRAAGVRCYAGFPLVANGEVFGVACFASTTRDRFHEGDLQVIQTVCDQVSAMLERTRLMNELHSREISLKLADRRKDEFIATLAHELRNPLAPIRNAIGLLRRDGAQNPQVAWCRDVIERQVTRMTHLLEDLLDVSRVMRNRIELRRERIELQRVIDEAVETVRPLIDALGHRLTFDLPDEPLVLYGDLTRLTQVLANLLNNAAKYTDGHGCIDVSARRCGDEVRIGVRDNGIGIEPHQLAGIFEMFSQLKPALERSQGGLGIGLSLSRGLVELHGGRLEAYSEGAGRGSEFVVYLPIVRLKGDSAPSPASATPAPIDSAAGGRRVLVVDDNVDAAQTLAAMLALLGLEVRVAFGGQEGLRMAEQWRPDAAVIDIGMPQLNGYEMCRRLRTQPWGEHMVLVACTGWGQDEDRQRARAAGFDHHVVKPVDPDALIELLAGGPPVRGAE